LFHTVKSRIEEEEEKQLLILFLFSFYHVCSYVTQFNNYYFSQEESGRERERELGERRTLLLTYFSSLFFDVHVR
jgi:hypothetical protein